MFIDLNDVEANHFDGKRFDVAICGAGFAGISLALRLSRRYSVALCEAGGMDYSSESQDLYKGQITGSEYFPLDSTRLRFFGGTSNHWGGLSRALDAHDFQPKPQNPGSGWPIRKTDLDPYVGETMSILDLGSDVTASCPNDPRYDLAGFEKIEFMRSAPTRMKQKYGDEIMNSERISCYLNANVVDLRFEGNDRRLETMELRDYENRAFRVNAKVHVIAAGAIENPRILLNCNTQRPNGLGNEHDLVGRYFSEHPHFNVGHFILEEGEREKIHDPRGRMFNCFYGPTETFLAEERVLNFGLRLRLLQKAGGGGFRKRIRDLICSAEWMQDAANSVRDNDVNCNPAPDGEIKIASEQALNRESRVLLNDELDRFGKRKLSLHWLRSPVDKRTLLRGAIRFGQEFAQNSIGRVRVADWLLAEDGEFPGLNAEETGGHHHMCTTRMAGSDQHGVVDRNLAVFGIDNLYMAGSSVFATSGHANPTFTIVQLSLRLADHLESVVD